MTSFLPSIFVPLTTLIFPAVVMASLFLYIQKDLVFLRKFKRRKEPRTRSPFHNSRICYMDWPNKLTNMCTNLCTGESTVHTFGCAHYVLINSKHNNTILNNYVNTNKLYRSTYTFLLAAITVLNKCGTAGSVHFGS